jgi:NitT/TauT family transport system ATP-binding protein
MGHRNSSEDKISCSGVMTENFYVRKPAAFGIQKEIFLHHIRRMTLASSRASENFQAPAAQTGSAGEIVAHRLAFRHGSTPILGDISFRIAPGEHVALLGRSGAGKSTLLHLLAGIYKPESGHLSVDGVSIGDVASKPVLMFQRPALLPWLTAYQNILVPLRFSGALRRDAAAAHAKVRGLIEKIGLQDRADALPVNLSGGQQQRIALARAMAASPSVLLLDEPFSALDTETRAALRRDIRALARASGVTLVTVTHDVADAAAMADRVLVLGGRPSTIEDDFELGSEPEHRLRVRLAHVRAVA